MRTIITIIFLLLQLGNAIAANQFIWLHGLEGEHGLNTWDIYSAMFTKNQGYVVEYASNKSIGDIAVGLYKEKIKPLEDQADSLVIVGYSMGGLVARSLLAHSHCIKGIVTVGAANNGSTLLIKMMNGRLYDNFFTVAIKKANTAIDASLYSGIFPDMPVTTLTAPILKPVNVFKSRTVNTTLFALQNVMNNAIGIYKFGYPCISDMVPGSKYLSQLNSTITNVPFLNIYGVEDHWQVVRSLGSLSKINAVKTSSNTDQSYDQEYVQSIQAGLAYICEIQTNHNLVYNILGVAAIFRPWIWIPRELVHKARFNWDDVYRYLETGIHTDLAGMLGAIQFKLQDYCYPASADLTKLTCKSAYLPVVTANDGLLSRSDVVLAPSVNRMVYNIQVVGVNHQEMGNHIAMRKLFDEIFNQKIYGNAFGK